MQQRRWSRRSTVQARLELYRDTVQARSAVRLNTEVRRKESRQCTERRRNTVARRSQSRFMRKRRRQIMCHPLSNLNLRSQRNVRRLGRSHLRSKRTQTDLSFVFHTDTFASGNVSGHG
jgi:hypothetical protein